MNKCWIVRMKMLYCKIISIIWENIREIVVLLLMLMFVGSMILTISIIFGVSKLIMILVLLFILIFLFIKEVYGDEIRNHCLDYLLEYTAILILLGFILTLEFCIIDLLDQNEQLVNNCNDLQIRNEKLKLENSELVIDQSTWLEAQDRYSQWRRAVILMHKWVWEKP